uniref:Uncharacterized protein n=1 Tax=Anguilla anguilla TaxID=7936 RepID=A0A0E9SW86_ANGAN
MKYTMIMIHFKCPLL